MSKTLNFNKLKKQYLTVELADEEKTVLLIGMPAKAIMDDLFTLKENLDAISDGENDTEVTDDLYLACAKVMSRNKGGIKITKEKLSDLFDFEDIMIFFNAYMEFIEEITSSKN